MYHLKVDRNISIDKIRNTSSTGRSLISSKIAALCRQSIKLRRIISSRAPIVYFRKVFIGETLVGHTARKGEPARIPRRRETIADLTHVGHASSPPVRGRIKNAPPDAIRRQLGWGTITGNDAPG